MRKTLPLWLQSVLQRAAGHRYYILVVGLMAFGATITFSFPFTLVLIPATLLAPGRWRELGLVAGLASGLGSAVLIEVFHHFGWQFVLSRYPDLPQSENWQLISGWLQDYGLWALLVIAASPLPQTPALLLCAMIDLPAGGVALAVGVGKSVKYLVIAWLATRSQRRLLRTARQ